MGEGDREYLPWNAHVTPFVEEPPLEQVNRHVFESGNLKYRGKCFRLIFIFRSFHKSVPVSLVL